MSLPILAHSVNFQTNLLFIHMTTANFLFAQIDGMPSEVELNPMVILLPMLVGFIIFSVVVGAIMWWGMFTKAGKPGWASMVPLYNVVVWLGIIGRPWWWLIAMMIPMIGLIPAVIACLDTAKAFGKEAGFGVGLLLLGFIFFPILSWGSAQYQGPAVGAA